MSPKWKDDIYVQSKIDWLEWGVSTLTRYANDETSVGWDSVKEWLPARVDGEACFLRNTSYKYVSNKLRDRALALADKADALLSRLALANLL